MSTPAPRSVRVWGLTVSAMAILPMLMLATPAIPRTPGAPLTGPWGTLELAPIVISPPLELLPREMPPVRSPQWVFPGAAADAVRQMLLETGLPSGQVEPLMATARPAAGLEGTVLTPEPGLVRGLPPETRARLYTVLGTSELNTAQHFAYRYVGTSADDWLSEVAISESTRQLVESLIYRQGEFLFFADMDLVRPEITDPDELQQLRKRLLRHATVVARLRIGPRTPLDEVVDYWGHGGRRTDIRPLLESLVEEGDAGSIDISHLLPTLARDYLYRYPRTTAADLDQPVLANCLWTVLNFFNATPDDRLLDMRVALATIARDYRAVEAPYQLGDIVAFSDASGNLFHVATYIASDLLFGKNGSSPLAPWSLLPLDRFAGYYPEAYARGWRITYLRRKAS